MRADVLHAFFIFWRYTIISTKELLINDDIKCKEVRLVDAQGGQLGVMSLNDAKDYSYSRGLDLVLISPQSNPPVCRSVDYGKYCYERDKKEKENRRNQKIVQLKEVQLSCRIDVHDFETRVNHAHRFLKDGQKVKTVIRFKGREMAHQQIGRDVMTKFIAACADVGVAEKGISTEGRFMSVIISPVKATPVKAAKTTNPEKPASEAN